MSQKEKLIKKYTTYPLPVEVDFEEFIKYLEICGFKKISIKGSHHIFIHNNFKGVFSVATMNGKKVKSTYIKMANDIIKKGEKI